jgi:3-oxoacyl-[acyl-carrier-protein] synthase I
MSEVFVAGDNIVSPLGADTAENFSALKLGLTGVDRHERPAMNNSPFYASLFAPAEFNSSIYTKFEQLLLTSIEDALRISGIRPAGTKTVLIVCSTKGNAHLLDEDANTPPENISLPASAARLARAFRFDAAPVVVSNACISGLLGMITGTRLIRAGLFENAVVTGADVISRFILSGFGSFQALSPGHCKPFDKDRRNGRPIFADRVQQRPAVERWLRQQ